MATFLPIQECMHTVGQHADKARPVVPPSANTFPHIPPARQPVCSLVTGWYVWSAYCCRGEQAGVVEQEGGPVLRRRGRPGRK